MSSTKTERQDYLVMLLQRRAAARTMQGTEARFHELLDALSAPEMHSAQEEADRIEVIAAAKPSQGRLHNDR